MKLSLQYACTPPPSLSPFSLLHSLTPSFPPTPSLPPFVLPSVPPYLDPSLPHSPLPSLTPCFPPSLPLSLSPSLRLLGVDDGERFVTEEQFKNGRRFRLLQLRDQGVSHSNITELNFFFGIMSYTKVGISLVTH